MMPCEGTSAIEPLRCRAVLSIHLRGLAGFHIGRQGVIDRIRVQTKHRVCLQRASVIREALDRIKGSAAAIAAVAFLPCRYPFGHRRR